MKKKCSCCGAAVKAEDTACKKCGAIQISSGFEMPATGQKGGGKLLWSLGAAAALILAMLLLINPLMLRFAPQVVLGGALKNTLEAMRGRGEENPIYLILSTLGSGSAGRIDGKLQYAQGDTQSPELHLILESDRLKQAYSLGLSFEDGGKQHSLSFYADRVDITGSYNQFRKGEHFGIHFDTFREDLEKSGFRSIADLDWFPGFEQLLESIRQLTNADTDTEERLEPYRALLTELYKDAVFTSGREKLALEGETVACGTITMEISEERMDAFRQALIALLSQEIIGGEIPDADALQETLPKELFVGGRVIFYLEGRSIIHIRAVSLDASKWKQMEITFAEGKTTLRLDMPSDSLSLVSAADQEGEMYTHQLQMEWKQDGKVLRSWEMNTQWDRNTGRLLITSSGDLEFDLPELWLLEKEEGFRLWFEHSWIDYVWTNLYSSFGPTEVENTIRVDITYEGQAYIEKPEFTPLASCGRDIYDDFITMLDQLVNGQ